MDTKRSKIMAKMAPERAPQQEAYPEILIHQAMQSGSTANRFVDIPTEIPTLLKT